MITFEYRNIEPLDMKWYCLKIFDCLGDWIPIKAALGGSLLFMFLLLVLVGFLFLRRRKKQKTTKEIEVEDENPVYGMYEFADGRDIDEGRSEFADANDNYGS